MTPEGQAFERRATATGARSAEREHVGRSGRRENPTTAETASERSGVPSW